MEEWLAFLGHKWNASVLWHLSASPKLYGELVRCLRGVTHKVLAERLEGLERKGLIARSPQATFPRSVRYSLTEAGYEIVAIIGLLEPWTSGRSTADDQFEQAETNVYP